ncbi:Mitochondrial chaperone Frataxin [Mycoblastus sanguinarius]|nr:Mitochondrial chaperone Frataxin [Mycoblastus sanguinarius]
MPKLPPLSLARVVTNPSPTLGIFRRRALEQDKDLLQPRSPAAINQPAHTYQAHAFHNTQRRHDIAYSSANNSVERENGLLNPEPARRFLCLRNARTLAYWKPTPTATNWLRRDRLKPGLKKPAVRGFFTTTPYQATAPSSTPVTEPSAISVDEYHKLSDAYIDTLVSHLEELQEEREDVDVEYSAGVLTLLFPPAGTYVLNKQPPNKQIWLSSPVSGPKRFDWVASRDGATGEGKWIYLRDGSTLSGLLEEEVGVSVDMEEVEVEE